MFLFLARSTTKMCLMLLQKVKKCFQTIKNRNFKSRKIRIFPKGLVHGFGQKFEIFHVFIFGKINHQNVFDVTLESQKTFLDYKKQKLKKVEKSGFFQRGHSMVLVKNLKFFHVFISGKINHQNMFDVMILESQKTFLHYKKQKVKKVEKSGFFQRR